MIQIILSFLLSVCLSVPVMAAETIDQEKESIVSEGQIAAEYEVSNEAELTRPRRPRRPIPRRPRRPPRGSYYDWGQGRDGWGYCYEWASNGTVLNGGQAQANYLCEVENPSYHYWGRGRDGFGYCYQYTAYGIAMNQGRAQGDYLCDRDYPSYYSWGRGRDGNTYCYRYTSTGLVMNGGRPVGNHLCR